MEEIEVSDESEGEIRDPNYSRFLSGPGKLRSKVFHKEQPCMAKHNLSEESKIWIHNRRIKRLLSKTTNEAEKEKLRARLISSSLEQTLLKNNMSKFLSPALKVEFTQLLKDRIRNKIQALRAHKNSDTVRSTYNDILVKNQSLRYILIENDLGDLERFIFSAISYLSNKYINE